MFFFHTHTHSRKNLQDRPWSMERKHLRVVLVHNSIDDVSKFDVVHLIVFNRAKSCFDDSPRHNLPPIGH